MDTHLDAGHVRLRALVVGVVLSIITIYMAFYSAIVVHASYLAIDHMPAGGIFVFFILVLFVNPCVGLIDKKQRLNSGELLVVFIMLLVTSSIVTMGLGTQLLPIIAAPFYYASPENRWGEFILPHLRSGLHPDKEAAQAFFEGLPAGESISWMTWIQPLFMWFIFIFALYMVMLFLMAIIRKQWFEKERLTYPLVQLPVAMVEDDRRGSLLKPLFRNKLFWLAFAIPVVISSINALNAYYPFFPTIPLDRTVEVFQRTTEWQFRLSFPIMGFTYLINQEVALSIWFFNLLYLLVTGYFNVKGLSSPENLGIYGTPEPILANFGTGAFIAFVFIGVWMARRHIADVFAKAFGKRDLDDSDEIISYRISVFGLILGLLIMIVWLNIAGMPLHIALGFIIFMMVFFIGLTRVIAEAGVATMISPCIGSGQMVSSFGSEAMTSETLASFSLSYVYHSDIRTFPMSAIAQGQKMKDWIAKGRKTKMFAAILISIVITFILSNYLVLHSAHAEGGANLRSWFFVRGPQAPYNWVVHHMRNPQGPNALGWVSRIAGIGAMWLLTVVRFRFLWWPLHPLGLAIGSVSWIGHLWFTIFLTWLIKAVILKYGGVRRFRQGKPFFMGLILGQYSIAAIWFIIDFITGQTGNVVFWI